MVNDVSKYTDTEIPTFYSLPNLCTLWRHCVSRKYKRFADSAMGLCGLRVMLKSSLTEKVVGSNRNNNNLDGAQLSIAPDLTNASFEHFSWQPRGSAVCSP